MHPLYRMSEGQLQALCRSVSDAVKAMLPDGTGFFLSFSPFGEGGTAQYVANIARPAAIQMLRETADRLESRQTSERDNTTPPPSLN